MLLNVKRDLGNGFIFLMSHIFLNVCTCWRCLQTFNGSFEAQMKPAPEAMHEQIPCYCGKLPEIPRLQKIWSIDLFVICIANKNKWASNINNRGHKLFPFYQRERGKDALSGWWPVGHPLQTADKNVGNAAVSLCTASSQSWPNNSWFYCFSLIGKFSQKYPSPNSYSN